MRFVVRQPIFNSQERVVGYELDIEDLAEASAVETVEAVTLALQRVPLHTPATVLCGGALLNSEQLLCLPPERVVLALNPKNSFRETLARIEALRKSGYRFALLDFHPGAERERWVPLVDWLGVVAEKNVTEVATHLHRTNERRIVRLVARQVHTRAQLAVATKAGFQYFHGEYFLHPPQVANRDVPTSKLACIQLLKELRRPELNLHVIEDLVKSEPSFCYRLLRYMNSAAFFGRQTITSIRHAMTLLGDDELRRWLSLMATVASGDGQPGEIVATAMLRARFCELLAEIPDHGFMTGLFSLMPTIVNMQLGALLSVVKLPEPADRALWGDPSPLRTVLDMAVAFERAQWQVVRGLADALRITDGKVLEMRHEAAQWTNEIMAAAHREPQLTAGR
jgi:EAL and modified HD-GYP domain-containing signal transduction protein